MPVVYLGTTNLCNKLHEYSHCLPDDNTMSLVWRRLHGDLQADARSIYEGPDLAIKANVNYFDLLTFYDSSVLRGRTIRDLFLAMYFLIYGHFVLI